MKGFIFLVEIAVAGILIAIILSSLFSAQEVKTNWERVELIEIGNSMAGSLKKSYNIGRIFNEKKEMGAGTGSTKKKSAEEKGKTASKQSGDAHKRKNQAGCCSI